MNWWPTFFKIKQTVSGVFGAIKEVQWKTSKDSWDAAFRESIAQMREALRPAGPPSGRWPRYGTP